MAGKEAKVVAVVLPDPGDIRSVVADYLDSMPAPLAMIGDREQIINNCINPFAMLISAWDAVDSSGRLEGWIFATFVRDLILQCPQGTQKTVSVIMRSSVATGPINGRTDPKAAT